MKKKISMIISFTLLIVYPMSSEATTAVDMWYPGGVDSFWIYNVPSLGQVIATAKETEIDGGKYKVIQEDKPFIGSLVGVEPDPFLTFREDESGLLRGYGAAANKAFGVGFKEEFVAAGHPEEGLNLKFSDDEWVILGGKDFVWTVMKVEVEAPVFGLKVRGSFEVQCEILRQEVINTEAGEFETFVIEYLFITVIEGEVDKKRLCTMWLAPNVGLIQIEAFGEISTLVDYHLTPNIMPMQGKAITSSVRSPTTWANLKRMR